MNVAAHQKMITRCPRGGLEPLAYALSNCPEVWLGI
jgi:hypothetical protein